MLHLSWQNTIFPLAQYKESLGKDEISSKLVIYLLMVESIRMFTLGANLLMMMMITLNIHIN